MYVTMLENGTPTRYCVLHDVKSITRRARSFRIRLSLFYRLARPEETREFSNSHEYPLFAAIQLFVPCFADRITYLSSSLVHKATKDVLLWASYYSGRRKPITAEIALGVDCPDRA